MYIHVNNTTVCYPYVKLVIHCIPSCNWTDYNYNLVLTVLLYSEFKLENIYPEVNFCGKNVCGTCYLWKLVFVDHWKNCQKLGPAKISFHMVFIHV